MALVMKLSARRSTAAAPQDCCVSPCGRDVPLGVGVLGVARTALGRAVLEQLTVVEEHRVVRDPPGLAPGCASRRSASAPAPGSRAAPRSYSVDTGSRAEVGSSSSSTSGPTARARARHSSCCCPPERRNGESPSRSLTASHRPTSRQPAARHDVELLALGDAVGLDAGHDVVADRHGKRVGPLEQHADPATQGRGGRRRGDQMLSPSKVTSPSCAEAGDLVVHPVEGAQEGGLARPGRADQRRDRAPLECVHVGQHGPPGEAERELGLR